MLETSAYGRSSTSEDQGAGLKGCRDPSNWNMIRPENVSHLKDVSKI